MFEEQTQTAGNPPQNLPTEPVDMFAGLDEDKAAAMPPGEPVKDALSAGMLKPKVETAGPDGESGSRLAVGTTPAATAEQAVYTMKAPILGKVLVFVVGVVVLGGLGFGGFWAYGKFVKKSPANLLPIDLNAPAAEEPPAVSVPAETPAPVVSPAPEVQEVVVPTATAEIPAQMKNDSILFGQPVDTDKDGLDDIREREIGTSLVNSDSDGDGLPDSDEVLIWKTDPLNPDSDGDSYVDGKEVYNGYNPLGSGKLFNVPASAPAELQRGTPAGAASTSS